MELTIKNDDEITLPSWIGGSKLTLAEIGAVATLACLEIDGDSEHLAARMGSPEMAEAVKGLKEKGVFKVSVGGNEVGMTLDLDAAANE